jgi:hypothetical protein
MISRGICRREAQVSCYSTSSRINIVDKQEKSKEGVVVDLEAAISRIAT